MAIATVQRILFNQKMKDKWDGAELHSITANGQKRKDFVFKKSEMHTVLTKLEVGDEIELKLEKNGNYWNLKDIVPTGNKSAAGASSHTNSGTSTQGNGSGKTGFQPRYADSKEYVEQKDANIIRQCALKAAVDIVGIMLQKDMYKKSATPDFIVEEIGRISSKFINQVNGEDAMNALAASSETLKAEPVAFTGDDQPWDE